MVLIDTSVWIEYFKGNPKTKDIDKLIDENNICVNPIILAELRPILMSGKQYELNDLLLYLPNNRMNINWEEIIHMQCLNLDNGINKVGIPDLLILQNAIQNKTPIWTFDKHFMLMNKIIQFEMYGLESLISN